MRKCFFIRCRAIRRRVWTYVWRFVVHVTSGKNIEERWRGLWRTRLTPGVGAMLPLSVRPSTWLRGRGRDRVALPRQRDLEGIRNRGSVPKRGLTQSQYANGLTHRAALHTGCHNTETSRSRPANLDQNPTFESPERACLYPLFMHFSTNISYFQVSAPLLIR